VTAGSIAGTAREAVDRLREEGIPAGLVRLRLFRPFPAGEVTARLRGARRIAVLDRNCSVGSGGIFAQEIRAALQAALDGPPPVLSYLLGLGGINVSVERVIQVGRDALRRPLPCPGPILEEAL